MKNILMSAFLLLVTNVIAQDVKKDTVVSGSTEDYGMRIFDTRTLHYLSINSKQKEDNSLFKFEESEIPIIIDTSAEEFCILGEKYMKEQKLDAAYYSYSRAIILKPTAKYYCKRGICLTFQSKITEALIDFDKAISIDNKYAEAYLFKGSIYQLGDDLKKAVKLYNKAIEANPKYADAYLMRGLVLGSLGKNKEACSDLEKAIKLGSNKASNQYNNLCK